MPLAAYNANVPALQFAAGRTILPTTLSAAELALLPEEIRQAAVFSAGVTQASVLDLVHDRITKLASGLKFEPGQTPNFASTRTDLKALLQQIGYAPADPRQEGTIQDLRTDARLNLILDTQLRLAHGWAAAKRDASPAVRLLYPAYEFRRLYLRRVPRGYKLKAGALVVENARYWQDRWLRAGGKLTADGRMIAPIDDPVWVKLSRFGLNQDPVDYNTGYGRRSVGAAECLRLGIVTREQLRALRLAAAPAGSGFRVPSSESKALSPEAAAASPATGAPALNLEPETRNATRLIDSFAADASRFFPALRAALVAKLKGLFELNSEGVLVASKGVAA
jgi:hypothetical protein